MYLDKRLWIFTEGVRFRIAFNAILGIVSTIVGIARLALLGWLLAKIFSGTPLSEMILPFVLTCGMMCLRGGLEFWRGNSAHYTAAKVQLTLRKRIYDKLMTLGPSYFSHDRTGATLLILIDSVEQLETYFGQYIPQLCVAFLTPIGIFAFVAFLDLPLAFTLLGFALFSLIAPTAFHRWDRKAAKERQTAYAEYGSEFLDSIQGLPTFIAFGQSQERAKELAVKAHNLYRKTMWVLATNSLGRGITDSSIALGASLALGIGAWRVVTNQLEIGILLIILMMGIEIFRPMRDLRILLHQGMLGQSAAEGIFKILNSNPLVSNSPNSERTTTDQQNILHHLQSTLEFKEVEFCYPGSPDPIHKKISFKIAPGQKIGIVGSSGCGKSSIVKLLLRLYDPTSGDILLGGHNLKHLTFEEIRTQFAVVHQDTYLFHGTAEENIRFGKPNASEEELKAAAIAANAHTFISSLPQGYQTVIGERGIRLSGGQRQRIAIARALLTDAAFLILDEALSAVDAENESIIQEALNRVMADRTVIILAHRLSSVINADHIYVLNNGYVEESGTHTELMEQQNTYYQLMTAQAEKQEKNKLVQSNSITDSDLLKDDHIKGLQPPDEVLRAKNIGWLHATRILLNQVWPFRRFIALTFSLGVLRVLALISIGIISALVVLAIRQGEGFDLLLIILYVLAPFAGVLHWLESWAAHDMAFRLLTRMRIALFDKLNSLAPAYLLGRRSGDLVSMATQDIENVEYFFAHTVAPAFVSILIPGAVLIAISIYGWPMAAALIPFLLIVAISPFFMRKRIDNLASRAREAQGELNAHSTDTLQGITEIIAFRQENRRGQELINLVHKHHAFRLPYFRDLTLQNTLVETVTGLGGLAVIISGSWMVSVGELERGMLPLLALLAMAAFLPISEIANIGRQLAETLGGTRRLHAVHSEPITILDGSSNNKKETYTGPAIELKQVSFTYPGTQTPAINKVNLSITSGSTVALVGPSGAGKTTLAQLLMRFWDPAEGEVILNGIENKQWLLTDLRDRIALVAQDTYLFNDTIRANILIARPSASSDDINLAIKQSALTEFIDSLPAGLETKVGEKGARLSGGQRQRIAIARAFLKDSPILILDEATSHLDALNEQLVRKALKELMKTRTTVVIAHRLSTIRDADQILVINKGQIIERGNHKTLLSQNGLYANLIASQLSNVTKI